MSMDPDIFVRAQEQLANAGCRRGLSNLVIAGLVAEMMRSDATRSDEEFMAAFADQLTALVARAAELRRHYRREEHRARRRREKACTGRRRRRRAP